MKHYLLTLLAAGSVAALFPGCSGTQGELPADTYVYFDKSSADVGVFQKDELLRVAQKMTCLDYSVFILADEKKQGKALADRRLNTVRSILLEAGVKKEDIATGFEAPRQLQPGEQDIVNGDEGNKSSVVVLYVSKHN